MNLIEKNNLVKKLLYRSKNRGYKENDLIIGKFAEESLPSMDLEDMYNFGIILNQSDADLYEWITHKVAVPPELNSAIMQKLLKSNII